MPANLAAKDAQISALLAEVERLQRIEAAARAYRVAVVNGGINAAEDELFAALDAAESGE